MEERRGGGERREAAAARLLPAPWARYRWSGAAEMAAATWEPAGEKEGQGFPSGPPARGGERREEWREGGRNGGSPREAPPAPEGEARPGGRRRPPARSPRGCPSRSSGRGGSLRRALPVLPAPDTCLFFNKTHPDKSGDVCGLSLCEITTYFCHVVTVCVRSQRLPLVKG